MHRHRHYLRPNTSSRRPSRLIIIDVESSSRRLDNGDEIESFLRAAIVPVRRRGEKYSATQSPLIANSISDAWDTICSQAAPHARTLVASDRPARTLGLLGHASEMQSRGWTLDDPVSSARFTAVAWRRDTSTLLFIAHSNLFPMLRLRPGTAEQRACEMRDLWIEYLALLDDLDCGDFHLSIGAQAMGVYRHKFLQHQILYHGNARADELERRACMGAVYQPYFYGQVPDNEFYYLDTNAMYPAMMLQHEFPWRLAGVVGICTRALLEEKIKSHDVIATCYIKCRDPHYPVREGGRTIFPIGNFTTTLTTPDLLYALEHNHLQDIYAMSWYDKADLFSGFVRWGWRLRRKYSEDARPMWAKWIKAIMVALYGRWGSHEFLTRDEGESPFDHDCADQMASAETGELRWYYTLAGKMWSSSRAGLHAEAFPAIMALIAAYGRNEMMRRMQAAGLENVFVCLSDGLIVNRAGYDRLEREIMPDEIGMLKLKMSGEELIIRSDVEYQLNAHAWRPGVRADAIEIEDGVFVQRMDSNLAALARKNSASGYITSRSTLRLERQIATGVVARSGRIEPRALDQDPLIPPRLHRIVPADYVAAPGHEICYPAKPE